MTGFYLAQTWPLRKRWWHFLVTKDPFSFFFSGRCLREEQRVFLSFFFRFTIAILPFSSKKKKERKCSKSCEFGFRRRAVEPAIGDCRSWNSKDRHSKKKKDMVGQQRDCLLSFLYIHIYIYIPGTFPEFPVAAPADDTLDGHFL